MSLQKNNTRGYYMHVDKSVYINNSGVDQVYEGLKQQARDKQQRCKRRLKT